jgi:hypothetical protein
MVAGISGASAGSTGVGEPDIDGKLMPPPHAPSKTVSADAAARLATVRALRELIIAFPRAIRWQIPGRSRQAAAAQPSAKSLPEQRRPSKLRRCADLVSEPASYIGLTKALTPLFA